jgi:von Willebrand factor type A domain
MRKRTLPRTKLALLAVFILARAALAAPNNQQQPQSQLPKHVDLVIALDTSSSMDGLIDSARQKLWDIVLLLGKARPTPVLRVGLISYGNTAYDSSVGWVRKESDLTTDLDGIYSKLFALKTMGGTEYVARAVHDATTQMQWDQDPHSLKIVFVAGNEPADQDPVIPVESAVQDAREKGIYVNAIYCGQASNGEAVGWQHVASLGKGRYAAIDQNRIVAVATPMDDELNKLSAELNKTYVAYGATGESRAQNQVAQDANARGAGGHVAASRAAAKASTVYSNEDWDLVDAKKKGKDVAAMPAAALPAPMRAMKPAERDKFVEEKARERAEIQHKIAEVNGKREAFIKSKKSASGKPADAAFDDAMMGAIRTEAEQQGFGFK